MRKITLRAHFDGEQVRLDEPFELEPGTPPTVVVTADDGDVERHDWYLLSGRGLETAYGANEPEYSLDLIKESNPEYEGR